MSNDNLKSEPKKGFPGGFFIFLLAAILVILTVQNLNNEKAGKVAFSYQVEHLVNLDLVQKEDGRKVALNDNLVSFSGKFRDRQTDDAKSRFRYLELLNRNHELSGQKKDLSGELSTSQKMVSDAADLFLHLSGLPIPKGGYRVVDPVYNGADRENQVVVRNLSDKDFVSYADLEKVYSGISHEKNPAALAAFGKDLLTLIEGFRSHALGIGNEAMKSELRNLEQVIVQASDVQTSESAQQQLVTYGTVLGQLHGIIADLDKEQQNVRLLQLRSVRTYKAQLEQFNYVTEELEKNDAQLDKARQAVANVTWFFNNQELSTKALEKQDSEVYGHWFAQAKQEWENFTTNKGTVFKAPDQPRNPVLEKTFKSEEPSPNYLSYLLQLLPLLVMCC